MALSNRPIDRWSALLVSCRYPLQGPCFLEAAQRRGLGLSRVSWFRRSAVAVLSTSRTARHAEGEAEGLSHG